MIFCEKLHYDMPLFSRNDKRVLIPVNRKIEKGKLLEGGGDVFLRVE